MTNGGDRRLSKEAQDLDDRLRGVASDLGVSGVKKKRRPWKVTFLFLIFLMVAIGILFVVILKPDLLTSQSEPLNASGAESTVVDQGAVPSEQLLPPADEDDEDDEAYPPIEVHVDVGAKDTTVSNQHVQSFYQIWPTPKTEGDLPALATPRLSGGTLDVVYDFEAMTVSGSFNLTYERNTEEDADALCKGSPEAFSGTASGSFDDLPIIEAITSDSPPPDWGLSPEDWFPGDEGDWYIGGSFPVELVMSGVAVVGCITSNGVTTYGKVPFNESATPTAWMRSSIDVARNQGPDHETHAFLNMVAETNESRDSSPFWDFSIALSHFAERPVPDPLE